MGELGDKQRVTTATNILSAGQRHDLVKGPPAVIFANGISLFVSDMIVRRHQDANRVCLCMIVSGAFYEAAQHSLISVRSELTSKLGHVVVANQISPGK